MEKHYRQKEYNAEMLQAKPISCPSDHNRRRNRIAGAPDTASFPSGGSTPWCFTTHPDTDLYCFRPVDMIDFEPDRIDGMWLSDPFGTGYAMQNFALEFNPAWIDDLEEAIESYPNNKLEPRTAGVAAAKFFEYSSAAFLTHDCYATFWLIDYRLKPRTSLENCITGKEQIFYGRGCRFVEVTNRDHWKARSNEAGSPAECWFALAMDVVDSTWCTWTCDGYCEIFDRHFEAAGYRMFHNLDWGVLACVRDTDSPECGGEDNYQAVDPHSINATSTGAQTTAQPCSE